VQHLARQRRKTPFSMRGWQARASLCNTLFMTRNETLGQRFESARRLKKQPARLTALGLSRPRQDERLDTVQDTLQTELHGVIGARAVVTQRLIFIPALLVVADPTQGPVATLSAVSFLAAFVLHSSVAEVWIRLTRRSGVPGTRAAKAA
jgi:hypothetical protein